MTDRRLPLGFTVHWFKATPAQCPVLHDGRDHFSATEASSKYINCEDCQKAVEEHMKDHP